MKRSAAEFPRGWICHDGNNRAAKRGSISKFVVDAISGAESTLRGLGTTTPAFQEQ